MKSPPDASESMARLRALASSPSSPVDLRVAAAFRDYDDPEALERAWGRLQHRRLHRGRRRLLVARTFAAAALLLLGVGVGMGIERMRSEPEPFLARSEVIGSTTSAAGSREARSEARVAPGKRAERRRPVGRRGSASALPAPDEVEEVGEPLLTAEQLLPPIPTEPERPMWLLLAERGDLAAAFQELDQSRGVDEVLRGGSAEELMTLADLARFAGRQARAIQALRAVTERHQTDPNAPLAAMMLGNLLSRVGDAEGAAQAYALNRTLSPGGDFAEDALVREFDMALAAEDVERVQRLLSQYEREFPTGRRLDEMRSAAEELEQAARDAPGEGAKRRPEAVLPTVNPYLDVREQPTDAAAPQVGPRAVGAEEAADDEAVDGGADEDPPAGDSAPPSSGREQSDGTRRSH